MDKTKLLEHSKGLQKSDPKTSTESLARTFLTSFKLRHTSTELGIFMGGFSCAFELIISASKSGVKLPIFKEVKDLEIEGNLDLLRVYSWALFNEYDLWRREQETKQINLGIQKTNAFVEAVHSSYKEFKKCMEEVNGKQKTNKGINSKA